MRAARLHRGGIGRIPSEMLMSHAGAFDSLCFICPTPDQGGGRHPLGRCPRDRSHDGPVTGFDRFGPEAVARRRRGEQLMVGAAERA